MAARGYHAVSVRDEDGAPLSPVKTPSNFAADGSKASFSNAVFNLTSL